MATWILNPNLNLEYASYLRQCSLRVAYVQEKQRQPGSRTSTSTLSLIHCCAGVPCIRHMYGLSGRSTQEAGINLNPEPNSLLRRRALYAAHIRDEWVQQVKDVKANKTDAIRDLNL